MSVVNESVVNVKYYDIKILIQPQFIRKLVNKTRTTEQLKKITQ
jgi:hypothetical protein